MEKFTSFLERTLMPLGEKLDQIRFLNVIRQAFMGLIPLTISGSVALLVLNFPFLDKVIPATVMDGLNAALMPLFNCSVALIAMYLVFLIGYNYSVVADPKNDHKMPGLVALASFLIMTPNVLQVGDESVSGVLSVSYLGAGGMFVAIIVGYLAAKIYCYFMDSKFKIKLPDSVPQMVSDSFSSLIPAFITLTFICIVNFVMTLTPFENIHNLITSIIQAPLMSIGTGVVATAVTQGLIQLLWFFGLQGDDIVGAVMNPILTTASAENLVAYQNGDPLPYLITQQFVQLFILIGFISLVIAMVIVSRSNRLKGISKLAVVPACFNISEPTVFGVPLVMNFILFIPWVLIRPIFVLITYAFMYFGLCPAPTGVMLPWTTPPILSGFLATNSIMGAVVQIVCLIVGVIIFIPFVKIIDKQYQKEEMILEEEHKEE